MSNMITAVLLIAPLASGAPEFGGSLASSSYSGRSAMVATSDLALAGDSDSRGMSLRWARADASSFGGAPGGGGGGQPGLLRRLAETVSQIVGTSPDSPGESGPGRPSGNVCWRRDS